MNNFDIIDLCISDLQDAIRSVKIQLDFLNKKDYAYKKNLQLIDKYNSRIVDLYNVKKDLEILYVLKKHLHFYSSESPQSEWCDLINLSFIPSKDSERYTEFEFVKWWYYKDKKKECEK